MKFSYFEGVSKHFFRGGCIEKENSQIFAVEFCAADLQTNCFFHVKPVFEWPKDENASIYLVGRLANSRTTAFQVHNVELSWSLFLHSRKQDVVPVFPYSLIAEWIQDL